MLILVSFIIVHCDGSEKESKMVFATADSCRDRVDRTLLNKEMMCSPCKKQSVISCRTLRRMVDQQDYNLNVCKVLRDGQLLPPPPEAGTRVKRNRKLASVSFEPATKITSRASNRKRRKSDLHRRNAIGVLDMLANGFKSTKTKPVEKKLLSAVAGKKGVSFSTKEGCSDRSTRRLKASAAQLLKGVVSMACKKGADADTLSYVLF